MVMRDMGMILDINRSMGTICGMLIDRYMRDTCTLCLLHFC